MGTIARMAVALEMDDRGFEKGIASAQRSAESFSKRLGDLGGKMSLAVTAPLVGIAGAAVKSAADFEQSMNIMQQVAGATGDEMKAMQKQALKLGAETAFSAGEAADAMLELAKAGMKPMQVMEAIPGVLDLAAAGGLGLAEAAGVTTAALNAFNMAASESGNVANMLAAAANASASDVTDLGAAVQQGGFAFAAAGQELDDLVASTAILSNVGLTGSDAGTALKNAMMRLMNPTKEAAEMMATLGINVYDTQGNMLDWADVIDEVDRATAGLTDEARNAALGTIFMSDGMKAMIPLLDEGKEGFLDMRKAINVQGSAANTANARMKGFAGAVEYLKGSVDSFLIEAALPFLDSLSGIVRNIADLITMVSQLPAPIRNTAIGIGALLAAAGPLMLIVSKLAPAFGMLGTVLGAIVSPVGLLVAAVGALVAVFATDFMGVRTALAGMVNNLLDMAGIDLDGIVDGFKAFGNYIGAVLEDGDSLNDWLTHLPPAIQPVVQAFGDLVATITSDASIGEKIQAIQANLGALWTSITELDWGGAWAAFQSWLNDWAQAVADSVQTIDWGGIAATGGEMFGTLRDTVVSAITSIDWRGGIAAAGEWLAGLRDTIVSKITSIDWGKELDTAGDIFRVLAFVVTWKLRSIDWGGLLAKAGEWLTGLTAPVVSALQSIDWGGIIGSAGDLFATFGAWVVYTLKKVDWGGLLGKAGDLFWSLTAGVIDTLVNLDWGGLLSQAGEWLADLGAAVINGLKSIDWGGILGKAGDVFSPLWLAVGAQIGAIDWRGALQAEVNFSDTLEAAVAEQLAAADLGAAISGLDQEWTAQMEGMVNDWAADVKTTDFTAVITNWLDSITKTFEETDWSALGVSFATMLNDAFSPDKLAANTTSAFENLRVAIANGIAGIDWTEVKSSLKGIDKAFADGLGEFAGAFSGTFAKPQWLTDLLAWSWPQLPETPIEWLNTLLTWAWPTLPDPPVAWLLTLIDWLWPELPGTPVDWLTTLLDWDWPKFPAMPDWIGRLLGWAGPTAPTTPGQGTPAQVHQQGSGYGGNNLPIPNNQKFDPYASGGIARGLALVGERGPELAFFGGEGARILSNPDSAKWLESLGIPGFADGTGPMPPIGPRLFPQNRPVPPIGPQMVQAITDASDGIVQASESIAESATAMGEASESLRSVLQSVPGLFGTSDVTADQMRLAEMGVPQEFADNYLRRLTDEVLNGVDWEGVDIQDAAKRAGIDPSLPSEVILELFKQAWNDSSLFANPDNLDLIDQSAVKAAIKKQQDQLAGQMNILQLFGITDDGLQTQIAGLGEALSTSFQTEFTPSLFEPVGAKLVTSMAGGFGSADAASTASGNMIAAIETSTATADMQNKLADAGESAASAYWTGWQNFFKTAQIPVPIPPGGAPLPPGMAAGGPVSRGVPYIIGERGPEMFIPSRSGQIIPNDELGGMWGDLAGAGAGGGGVTLNHYGDVVQPLDLKALAYEVAQLLNRRR